ncbi:MAG: MFS transporter [Pseudolabrys sp.]
MSIGPQAFFGWRVVAAAFVLAIFGWGLGFYGPPIYLHTVREARGWSVPLVSAAVTVHYLFGAFVIANLPKLYHRFGLSPVTKTGAVSLALGLVGWSVAREPWQLFVATLLSGAGWVTMGAAAINAIVSPWFVSQRPKALSTAYNGASVGGIVFSPFWVAMIGAVGFPAAATIISLVTVATVWLLADRYFVGTPAAMGQEPDGGVLVAPSAVRRVSSLSALPGRSLWADWRFRTLAAGMALGLFAQIGLLAHLFSLIVPALGAQWAGVTMGLATASAIVGRTAFGWLMPADADRRIVASLSFGVQIVGALVLLTAGAGNAPLILLGVVLFGFGIGNATSLPPLIAQVEFVKEDTPRVVALIVAIGQATYAFAPAVFGILRELPNLVPGFALPGAAIVFIGAALVQVAAVCAFLAGRKPRLAAQRPGNAR